MGIVGFVGTKVKVFSYSTTRLEDLDISTWLSSPNSGTLTSKKFKTAGEIVVVKSTATKERNPAAVETLEFATYLVFFSLHPGQ